MKRLITIALLALAVGCAACAEAPLTWVEEGAPAAREDAERRPVCGMEGQPCCFDADAGPSCERGLACRPMGSLLRCQ